MQHPGVHVGEQATFGADITGIDPHRMGTKTYASYQPVAAEDTANRRVEIYVLSPELPVIGRTSLGRSGF